MNNALSRRQMLKATAALGLAAGPSFHAWAALKPGSKMRLGLVTYLWGQDWDIPTLIANCEKTRILGVELRTGHAHGVGIELSAKQRREVEARFADSPVLLVGLGTNEAYHFSDAGRLDQAIEATKTFIKLSHDVGGSGVKVKPNDLPGDVPRERTIEQIGTALNLLGAFGADYGQEIRLEVHGQCSHLPTIHDIMQVADHPNVGVCWNCNNQDLEGEELEHNFNLVKDRFGATAHVRELNIGSYPYQMLIDLFVKMDYEGWVLLEARTNPQNRIAALNEQREVWGEMVSHGQSRTSELAKESGVAVTNTARSVRVEIDGALFTEYHFQNAPRPYFYPVIGPAGDPMTRHWPMKEGEHEAFDHPHHRSLWYAHGDVNGHDFWEEREGHGRIVHDTFLETSSGPKVGVIASRNNWVTDDGDVVCSDTRTHRFTSVPEGVLMDFDITIHASQGDVTFGDTKEGSMALRLAPTMRVRGDVGEGHIVNSEGERDGTTWGKRAAWCDYYGPVNGKTVGVAIFDHPANPKHPTWWHVRDYGLFAANPFGVHDFEGKPPGSGDIHIASGENLTFRYRLFFHLGDEKEADVAKRYREYAAE